MRNAGLEEAQTGIKIARRNINNLRYADDTTLMPGGLGSDLRTEDRVPGSDTSSWLPVGWGRSCCGVKGCPISLAAFDSLRSCRWRKTLR